MKLTQTVQNLTKVDKSQLIDESAAKTEVQRLTVDKRGSEQCANRGAKQASLTVELKKYKQENVQLHNRVLDLKFKNLEMEKR